MNTKTDYRETLDTPSMANSQDSLRKESPVVKVAFAIVSIGAIIFIGSIILLTSTVGRLHAEMELKERVKMTQACLRVSRDPQSRELCRDIETNLDETTKPKQTQGPL